MSADNWAVCPQCYEDAYGVKPDPCRWDTTYGDFQTFREDYEIFGAESGVVEVSYSGHCKLCGLKLTFGYDVPIPGVKS